MSNANNVGIDKADINLVKSINEKEMCNSMWVSFREKLKHG